MFLTSDQEWVLLAISEVYSEIGFIPLLGDLVNFESPLGKPDEISLVLYQLKDKGLVQNTFSNQWYITIEGLGELGVVKAKLAALEASRKEN